MMVALIVVIIGTMGGITPQDVAENILAVILILALGIFGIMTGGLIASKIVGWHPDKGMPVALTARIGFPGDDLVCEEVARRETDKPEAEWRRLHELGHAR